MKVSDYIAQRLVELGVEQVFSVVGGGAMHLNDSFANTPGLKITYMHHEQACAIAAEGCQRASGKTACVLITTGPGGLNTLTGVMGQWTDSVPVIYISGQVNYDTTIESCKEIGLRQLGDQEVDIIPIVKPLTKHAVTVSVTSVQEEIEHAWFLAHDDRPGPVWINVPMNIQNAQVDEKKAIHSFYSMRITPRADITYALDLLESANRPLIIAGNGIHIAKAEKEFLKFIDGTNIPVVTTFNGFDLMNSNHPQYIGNIGTIGSRAGNFVLQNCDVLLILGSRNNIRQVSYKWENFAPQAIKIVVDIDNRELTKPTMNINSPNLPINCGVKDFFTYINVAILKDMAELHIDWLKYCQNLKVKYPVMQDKFKDDSDGVNLYYFFNEFTKGLKGNSIGIAGNGSACVGLFQAGVTNPGVRYFWNSGCAAMGYGLPASIGAALSGNKKVYCFEGDGSFQMNIQELQTVVANKLPIKIIYLNNGGYSSIKQTQDNYFHCRTGCDPSSGVTFPNIEKIAKAYGIEYIKITNHEHITYWANTLKNMNFPVIVEVMLQKEYAFEPKLAAQMLDDGTMVAPSFENMWPFLSEDEIKENMIGRQDDSK